MKSHRNEKVFICHARLKIRKEKKTAKIFTCSAEWSDFINFHVSIEEFHWDSIISRYFLICFLGQLACLFVFFWGIFAEESLLITRISSDCLAQFRLSYAAPWELAASAAAAAAVAQVSHRCQQRPHYVPKRASISAVFPTSLSRSHSLIFSTRSPWRIRAAYYAYAAWAN